MELQEDFQGQAPTIDYGAIVGMVLVIACGMASIRIIYEACKALF